MGEIHLSHSQIIKIFIYLYHRMSEQETGNLLRKTTDLMKGKSIMAMRSQSDYGYDIIYGD